MHLYLLLFPVKRTCFVKAYDCNDLAKISRYFWKENSFSNFLTVIFSRRSMINSAYMYTKQYRNAIYKRIPFSVILPKVNEYHIYLNPD